MKKSLSIVLSFIMIISTLGALPFTAHAATLTDGDCGVNATYHFVASSGELQINGSGEMWDFSIFGSPFYSHTEIKAVYISANIESIGDNAFAYCTGLTALRMGAAKSLKTIGESAFYECTNLSTIVYPSSCVIDTIGASAFQNCTKLESFQVPSNVYTIKESTFKNCSSLRIVSLRYVDVIKNDAFRGCDALRDVCYSDRLVDWKNVSIGSNNGAVTNATFHENCIGDVIGENAIYTIDWDCKMTISGTGATYDYKEVDPGTPLNNLPWSFYYITVEEGITAIGSHLFYNCKYIDSITLPRSLTSIGAAAFLYCTDLDTVKYPGTQDQLKAITDGATSEYSNKQLFDAAFTQAYNYQGKCGGNLRYDFDTVTNTMTILGSGNMWDFTYYGKIGGFTMPWNNFKSQITNLVINNGVTSVGNFAFAGTHITSLTTPTSMKRIGNDAFAYCTYLNNITINGKNCVIENDAFTDGSSTVDAIKLSGVKSVGENAFYDVYSNTIDLGTIETIGYGAFSCNEHVTSVNIPATCTFIDDTAFSGCKALTSIAIFNPECKISDEKSTFPEAATIYGLTGSTAQTYATNNNRTFVSIGCYKHTPGETVTVVGTPATYDKEGYYTEYIYCVNCGAELSRVEDIVIPKLAKTSLAKATVSGIKDKAYTGKNLYQSITVTLGGKTLVNGTDYKVTYKNCANIGTATLTISGINAYSGTITKTYKINPKGTSLSKVTAGKKAFTATWKKQATKTTGYQIQYSTSSNFKNAKTVTVKKNKTTKTTVKKLKAKKKYYVRIRTYETVNGKNYYSSWSKAKTVKTKK